MGNTVSLEDEMVNLRIVSKQMQRSSKKCEKNEKTALGKLKKVSSRLSLHRGIQSSFTDNDSNVIFISIILSFN